MLYLGKCVDCLYLIVLHRWKIFFILSWTEKTTESLFLATSRWRFLWVLDIGTVIFAKSNTVFYYSISHDDPSIIVTKLICIHCLANISYFGLHIRSVWSIGNQWNRSKYRHLIDPLFFKSFDDKLLIAGGIIVTSLFLQGAIV